MVHAIKLVCTEQRRVKHTRACVERGWVDDPSLHITVVLIRVERVL